MALSDVKAGDEVIVVERPLYNLNRMHLATVDRTTATQIILGNTRFWRKNGLRVGVGERWYISDCIVPADDEHRAAMATAQAEWAEEQSRNDLVRMVADTRWRNLPTSALERIVAIIEGEKGEE